MLFDAGLDAAIGTDPDYISSAIGRFFLRKLFRLNIGPDDTLASKLNALVFQAADVHKVIVSHLHFDHIGYIKEVPQAEFLISGEEWTQLSGPHPEIKFILREHIEVPGANWRQIEFTPSDDPFFAPFGGWYDVMEDGTIILLPTSGHMPGSMSFLARTGDLPLILLVGDLIYDVEFLMKDKIPEPVTERNCWRPAPRCGC